jgi:hypothetical protein
MNDLGPWDTEDFDRLSWHDVHAYGLRLDAFDKEGGTCDLILDIDYILHWEQSEPAFKFTMCQASLRFHKVFGLKMALDYPSAAAGMCPFSIHGIEREPMQALNGDRFYRWRIAVNWPQGHMAFDAMGFTQTLIGSPSTPDAQSLRF